MARQASRLTLKELGVETGISTQSLQQYEAGLERMPSHHLVQVCGALKIDMTSLFPELRPDKPDSGTVLPLQKKIIEKLIGCSNTAILRRIDLLLSNE